LVNAQNGHLDAAIENFAKIVDKANQQWDRKFDFTQDYVVLNELALTLFKRSQQEDEPAARDAFLRRAVEHYEATLKIDPEDLDAHYGLAQSYARLGETMPTGKVPEGSGQINEDLLVSKARTFSDGQATKEARLETARWLGQTLPKYAEQPSQPGRLKLPTLLALIGYIRPVYEQSGDEELRAAAAHVLGRVYRQTHLIYKPDDNARDRTVRLYRQKNPAADHASQAIVIYPTDRPGAPGR
jgi:tetratricopeptide (TPR) repeat protein